MTHLRAADRIYRYTIPVDFQWHTFALHGDPLHVANRDNGTVDFWARFTPDQEDEPAPRAFLVVGTGHTVPANARYWGTTLAAGGALVWHLVERDDT